MSCEGSSPDMDDRRNPPSLVDESSITIRLPTGSMSSCSEDRSSPCKAPSLSSQSDIYALSDKEDYQSDKDESTHQYQEDAKRDEDVRPKKFCNGEHIILARRDDDTCTHRPEYFRSSETIRQFQKNMDHNEGNNTNPLSGDDYFKPMNKPRKLKKGVIHDEENSSTPPPDEEYFRPIKKLRMVEIRQQEMVPSPPKPLTSFFIKDILNHKPTLPRRHSTSSERAFVRPWDLGCQGPTAASSRRRPRSADDDSRSEKSETDSSGSPGGIPINASPLDALFEMTSKAFEGLDADEKSQGLSSKTLLFIIYFIYDPTRDHLSLFSNRVQPKKKRKSRTAFTNHQIFELEKRFLYQKYLSPADRDEIAQSLGLTNAQVITWFQNRRAKLKRDMEELKKDVDAAKVTTHRTILSSYHDVAKQNLSTDTDS